MRYTENFRLKKPEQTDSYNIEDFNENADILDRLLTPENVSEDFIAGTSGCMSATNVNVIKQGKLISGNMKIHIFADGPGDEECYLTINAKYRASQSINCPFLCNSISGITDYVTIDGDRIDYGVTNSTEGSAFISFCYICE